MAADGVCKVGAALAPRSAGKPIRVSQSNIPWEQPCPPSTLKSATVREVLNDDSNLFDVCVKFKADACVRRDESKVVPAHDN